MFGYVVVVKQMKYKLPGVSKLPVVSYYLDAGITAMENVVEIQTVDGSVEDYIPFELVKKYLRITSSEDDEIIRILVSHAIELFEDATKIIVVPKTFNQYINLENVIDNRMYFEYRPVTSVASFQYRTGESTYEDVADYGLYLRKIQPFAYVDTLPTVYNSKDAFKLVYSTGWNSLPDSIRSSILLLVNTMYTERDANLLRETLKYVTKGLPYYE